MGLVRTSYGSRALYLAEGLLVTLMILLSLSPKQVAAQTAQPVPNLPLPDDRMSAIVGGEVANQGEWGWQVMIQPRGHLCGGSLIATDWVVTAAHCVYDEQGALVAPHEIIVTVGERDRGVTEGTEQTLEVSEIFPHESFNDQNKEHDIALLHLVEPALLSEAVTIVPLLTDEDADLATVGQVATVTGWGATDEGGYSTNVLMEVTVPIVDNDLCNRSYGIITDTMLCAGYVEGGKDSCQGDSGGPLVIANEEGEWYLTGIVSFGYGCARADYYGVYTRVSSYASWIQEIMATYSDLPLTPGNEIDDQNIKPNSSEFPSTTLFLPIVLK